MNKTNTRLLPLWAAMLLAGGCVAFRPPDRDANTTAPIPEKFSLYNEPVITVGPWWESFQAPELNRLIDTALGENFTIQRAWARLEQAEAVARIAQSRRWPDLQLDAGAGLTKREAVDEAAPLRISGTTEDYMLGLSSRYEVDLWGRVRAAGSAATFDAAANALDLQTAAMTVSIRIADTWCNLVAQRAQLTILHHQLEANEKVMDLIELRFRNALATALDVYQQRQAIAETRAAIPLVEALEQVLQHELAVLIGRTPGPDGVSTTATLPMPGPLPRLGLPADLLANRPDIQAAGLRLRGADWQVSAARADRLPAVRLTARAAYESGEWVGLFDNWVLNLSANLTGPLFDAGRRRAEVARTRAVVAERLVVYRETVAVAVKEVENALIQESKQREHLEAVTAQIEAARKAYEESGSRYLNGLSDYLPVLTALLIHQRLEVAYVRKQVDLITYRLALYRAMGGNWMQDVTPEGLSQAEETPADDTP